MKGRKFGCASFAINVTSRTRYVSRFAVKFLGASWESVVMRWIRNRDGNGYYSSGYSFGIIIPRACKLGLVLFSLLTIYDLHLVAAFDSRVYTVVLK
jgi:hypothetical protein